MSRTMYDTTTVGAGNVPAFGDMFAGYVNGAYPTYFDLKRRFPAKKVVSITVTCFSMNGSFVEADVLDREAGDAPAKYAPVWAKHRRSIGKIPTVYCAYGDWQEVKNQFAIQSEPQPLWWIACYDDLASLTQAIVNGKRVDITGITAKQYGGNSHDNYDYSIVDNVWPGVDYNWPFDTDEDSMSAIYHDDDDARRCWVRDKVNLWWRREPTTDEQNILVWDLATNSSADIVLAGIIDSPHTVR